MRRERRTSAAVAREILREVIMDLWEERAVIWSLLRLLYHWFGVYENENA
jgi:hypothetical protein